MIKTLQKKFIITAMAAITLLILVILGTINGINIWRVHNESDNTMQMLINTMITDAPPSSDGEIGDGEGAPEQPQAPEPMTATDSVPMPDNMAKPEQNHGMNDIFNPVISEDMVMAARYFCARIDTEGNIVYTDVSNISSVDGDEAERYIRKALSSGKTEGSDGDFHYEISDSGDGQGSVIIFLNVSNIRRNILSVLIISVIIGLVGFLLMLLVVVALSKHAIKPIAANIERQKQFVTDAGHEIKTPLAIILANTDAMELHNGESKWSRNIRSQAERLTGLMKNLLALSKMDERGIEVEKTELDVSAIAKETSDSFSEPAALKNIELSVFVKGGIRLRANREQVTQLMTILLDNAIKYSPDNERIEFTVDGGHHSCIIKCRNACESLPDIPADRLFDRFYRGDSARTQKSGGYGIGLSMAKAITELNKGKIKAAYDGDRHIIFTIIL